MWRGDFELGEAWAAYTGPTDQNEPHAHVALQLAMSPSDELELELDDGLLRSRGLLIAPLARHRVAAGAERVVFLYVEPQAPLGRALRGLCGEQRAVQLPERLRQALGRGARRAVEALSRELGVAASDPIDPRLSRALGVLAAGGSVAGASVAVGLSESALRRLARAELGTPLARWTLWRKLARAGGALAAGASAAEAAASGPFADQAHLARTMRRMFGITTGEATRAIRSRPGGGDGAG